MRPSAMKALTWIALLLIVLTVPVALPQSELDLIAERRIVTYIRQHVEPGQFFLVTNLYKVFKTHAEKKAIDRLYDIFFKIPLFVAQYKQDTDRFPKLDEIARQFELQIPGEVSILLSIFDADPRAPKFFTRDAGSGEITGMDIAAAGENLAAFKLGALTGARTTPAGTGTTRPELIAVKQIPCEKASDVALEKALARSLISKNLDLEGTEYYYNRVDLNGDGIPEVLAYLRGPHTCNADGCELFVLEKQGTQYLEASKIDMSWMPVAVSSRRNAGWNDLILRERVSGGGRARYIAIPFDGKTYKMENARPLTEEVEGTVYMSNSRDLGAGIRLPLHIGEYGKPAH